MFHAFKDIFAHNVYSAPCVSPILLTCIVLDNHSLEQYTHLRLCSLNCQFTLRMRLLLKRRQQTFVQSRGNTSMSHHIISPPQPAVHTHARARAHTQFKGKVLLQIFTCTFCLYGSVKWTTKCYTSNECLVIDGEATTILPAIALSK